MDTGTITEAQFLLTELQYTLGQLHVQLADLDEETRQRVKCGDRTIEQVLSDLGESETSYQSQYARLLDLNSSPVETSDHVALPVYDDVEQDGSQSRFEHLRTHTIEMLQGTEGQWTQEVLDLVKKQVMEDRVQTTQIAECRKTMYEGDARPDLDEPLTTSPSPHELASETGSHLEPGDEAASVPSTG
jgi:hypothetical protein